MHPHDSGVRVERDDDAVDAVQIAGARVMVDPHSVAHVKRRQRLLGIDRVQQLLPGADRLADRDKVLIELACCDLVQQQLFRLSGARWRGGRTRQAR